MNDTVYTVETKDGKKLHVEAASEDEAFSRLIEAGNTAHSRESLKFTAGKLNELPDGTDVI